MALKLALMPMKDRSKAMPQVARHLRPALPPKALPGPNGRGVLRAQGAATSLGETAPGAGGRGAVERRATGGERHPGLGPRLQQRPGGAAAGEAYGAEADGELR